MLGNELFSRLQSAERTANFPTVNDYERVRRVNKMLSK